MPRDANGNYTNANPPVNAGETVLASTYNTENDDKATELTESLSRSGKGGMLAQLKAIDGSAAAPGVSFLNELSSGMRRESPGNVRMPVLGLDLLELDGNARIAKAYDPDYSGRIEILDGEIKVRPSGSNQADEINNALAAGRPVRLMPGDIICSARIVSQTNPVGVLRGSGIGITRLLCDHTDEAIHFGKPPLTSDTGIFTGGVIEDLTLRLDNALMDGIRILQTQQTVLRNFFIIGNAPRPHTQQGVIIDGRNGSSFFNELDNLNCIGTDIAYLFTSTGSTVCTKQVVTNCNAICYPDNTNSVGFQFDGGNGLDSVFLGGNIENSKKGIQMATGTWGAGNRTQGTTWFGMRWEANHVCDIDWGNGGFRNMMFGYGNYGNNATPGYTPSLNFDITRQNVLVLPSGPPLGILPINGEEGEWTPAFFSTGATFTHSNQIGRYTKIGNRVTATFTISGSYTGTDTNSLRVSGLPFACQNVANLKQAAAVGLATGLYVPQMNSNPASTNMEVQNGAEIATPASYFGGPSTDKQLRGSITYLTDT